MDDHYFRRLTNLRETMVVLNIQYNKFSEINHLNENFIPGVNKLKLTIDAVSPIQVYEKNYPLIKKQFNLLFPKLKQHFCYYENVPANYQTLSRDSKYVIETIHLIEHVIIDLQCAISKMKICSGVTCVYTFPRNRFDIFIESLDEKVGYFAAQFAIEMVQRILNNDRFLTNDISPLLNLQIIRDPDSIQTDYSRPLSNLVLDNLHHMKN